MALGVPIKLILLKDMKTFKERGATCVLLNLRYSRKWGYGQFSYANHVAREILDQISTTIETWAADCHADCTVWRMPHGTDYNMKICFPVEENATAFCLAFSVGYEFDVGSD